MCVYSVFLYMYMYIQFQFGTMEVLDKATQTSTICQQWPLPSEDLMRTCTGMDGRANSLSQTLSLHES